MTAAYEATVWKHPDLLQAAPSLVRSLREEAYALLESHTLISPELARQGLIRARLAGDDLALAFWSRLRVRAMRGVADRELVDF
jgi:hypothetical protein